MRFGQTWFQTGLTHSPSTLEPHRRGEKDRQDRPSSLRDRIGKSLTEKKASVSPVALLCLDMCAALHACLLLLLRQEMDLTVLLH